MDRMRNFGFLLKDVSRRYVLRFEQRAREISLTLPQCKALVRLEKNEGVSQARLAELADVEPMTMVRILDRMEADGLLERRPDPGGPARAPPVSHRQGQAAARRNLAPGRADARRDLCRHQPARSAKPSSTCWSACTAMSARSTASRVAGRRAIAARERRHRNPATTRDRARRTRARRRPWMHRATASTISRPATVPRPLAGARLAAAPAPAADAARAGRRRRRRPPISI